MKLTSALFDAFLKCPTKCYLRSTGQTGTGNAYAEWVRERNDANQAEAGKRLMAGFPAGEVVVAPSAAENLKVAKWRLALDLPIEAGNIEARIHAVERVPSEGRGKPAQFIPVRFVFSNKLTKDDRLLLAFDALVLSEVLGREVSVGKIIHGDDHATLKVKVAPMLGTVRMLTGKMSALLADGSPPDLILNRHCGECEFRDGCRQKAAEKDDLSLLGGMTKKERKKYHSKGIFTVAQLSYTFRPRRTPKRVTHAANPHHSALQALAIRKNTIYIHGDPQIPDSTTRVYLDIEGLPDGDFYYLLGALFVTGEQERFYSFWADEKSDQPALFADFAEEICRRPDFRVLHYGNYDTVALKRMRAIVPDRHQAAIDTILKRATNILSLIYPHIYLPVYSNSLKEIGRFLGCKRTNDNATGLSTIMWRRSWEANHDPNLKNTLLQYNQEDCRALKQVCNLITDLSRPKSPSPEVNDNLPATSRTDELLKDRPHWDLFRVKEYASEDFKHLCKCAYFDYQREKVLVRTDSKLRTINKRHRRLRRTKMRPNATTEIECSQCPSCHRKTIDQTAQLSRFLIDLKFSGTGVKKWITKIHSYRYRCRKCGKRFNSELRSVGGAFRYGHGMMSWCVYTSFFCDMKMSRTRIALGDTFGIFVDDSRMMRSREIMSGEYQALYLELLENLLAERVIHIDETSVKLAGSKGFVWVIAGMDKVYYFYRPTREGTFLQTMLQPFSGVLVSDFYAAYDSLACQQQKCLVHFVRDLDDDVLKHPLDAGLKIIAEAFGALLRTIIQTVDNYGLKNRYMRKHKAGVARFLDSVAAKNFTSEVCRGYQNRFQKSGRKMFTFLDYDGVPWNNNNAEHSIKRFAKFRTLADGRFTERSLKEYLVLVSVFQTCEINNVNVLRFLLSKDTTLDGLFRMAGRKTE